jgi:hypothetical protein
MDLKRPSCHEAGRAVVALFFGFCVERIEVSEGRLRTMCQLDAEDKTDGSRVAPLPTAWAPGAVLRIGGRGRSVPVLASVGERISSKYSPRCRCSSIGHIEVTAIAPRRAGTLRWYRGSTSWCAQ